MDLVVAWLALTDCVQMHAEGHCDRQGKHRVLLSAVVA